MDDLVNEGKELIRKPQKLIRITNKSVDGLRVVDEYISDELASASEDEKRLKKAKEAASRKSKQATQAGRRGSDRKFKGPWLHLISSFFVVRLRYLSIFVSTTYFALFVV